MRIDGDAVSRLAQELIDQDAQPEWDSNLHYRAEDDEHTAMWILVLDTLNFCFWADDPAQRWKVRWRGELVDGYVALVAALTNAMESGYPLHDPQWLANAPESDVADILAPAEGYMAIPLFGYRVDNLRELGRTMSAYGDRPATNFIHSAQGSAIALVQQVVREIPSFNDSAHWLHADTGLPGSEVRFYKRAQILAGDLAGGLTGSPLAAFHDLGQLTAFADYKVPQILRELGVLIYDDELARIVDSRKRIPAGSELEVEIRAATVIACDRIASVMRASDRDISSAELDWLLWSRSQSMPAGSRPYHLTETIYY